MTQDGSNKKTQDNGTLKNGVVEHHYRGGRGRGNRGRGNRKSWKSGRGNRGGGSQPRVEKEKEKEKDRTKDKNEANGAPSSGHKANAGGNVQKRGPQENKFGRYRRSSYRGGYHQKRGKDLRHKPVKNGPSEDSQGHSRETHNAHPQPQSHRPQTSTSSSSYANAKETRHAKRMEKGKEQEKGKVTSPLHKSVTSMRPKSWADDEVNVEPKQEPESLEREKSAAGNQVSAASRAIAQLQIKVGELEQEKRAMAGKLQRLEQAGSAEKNAHVQTRAKLEGLQQKFNILERVNANFENLRTRLENERESLRKQLFHSKTRATTALGSIDYATELKRKENALESSNKEISALKADIEYHHAQHDYMQIRLENMEAENVELKKKLSDMLK